MKKRVELLEKKVDELSDILEALKKEAFTKSVDGKGIVLQDKKSLRLYLDVLSVLISLEKEIRGYKELLLKEGKTEEETDQSLKLEKERLEELRRFMEDAIKDNAKKDNEASKDNGKN